MTTFDPPRPWTTSYAEGVPEDLDEVSGSLVDIVAESARRYPDAVALEFFGRETTYRSLDDQVARVAEGLRARGVGPGDRVAIVLPNCAQHVVAFYAVLRLGAVVVEHNPLYTAHELRTQFADHGARTAIVWTKTVATIQAFPEDLAVPTLVAVDVVDAMPWRTRLALRLPVARAREARAALRSDVRDVVRWSGLAASPPVARDVPSPTTDDVAIVQYTSGTTGTPKGAVLTHRNLLANAAQARAWVPAIRRGPGCVVYAVLPMFHAYGLTLCLTFAMSMGARLVLFPRFDPGLVLAVARRRPATFLPLVPPIAERLLRSARQNGVSLEGTQIAISGAMALPHDLVVPFEAATGGYLVEGYGLSECSPVLMANPVAPHRVPGSVGLPLPGTECRVVDPEHPTDDVAPGDPGELVVRGPQVFREYLDRPDETEAVFVDGWFRTGDIVTIDEAGFVRIVDRIKEIIITGGFNVAPTEVENVLRLDPSVADVAVVGLPHAGSGEQVVAAVVPAPGATVDPEALRALARAELAAYKVPRRIVIVDDLPKSLIGKVLRRRVREGLLAAGHAEA